MPKISQLDEYLHADAVKDGDIITIIGKATLIDAETSVFERAYLEVPVKLPNGEVKTWTPNKTSLKQIAAHFGDETDLWVSKKVKVTIARQNVRGEMKNVLYGEPVVEQTATP